jgi:competence protein ComEC
MFLPFWVAALAVGIAASALLGPPWLLALAALAAAVGAWQVRQRRGRGIAAVALAAGALLGLCARPPPVVPLADAEPQVEEVLAGVIRGPDREDATGVRVRIWLRVGGGGRAAGAMLVLSAAAASVDVAPGDLVSFRAALRAPSGLANPGLPDARVAARAQGIDLFATLAPGESMRRLRAGSDWGPRRLAWRLRRAMGREIGARAPPAIAAFLLTVALGERAGVDDAVEDGFRAAGATHVLSVSGLHLAAVAGLVFFVIRRAAGAVPALALRVNAGRIAAAVALPVVGLYTLLSGEALATERSALMTSVALLGAVLGRRSALPTAVAAAALVLLIEAPMALFDVSFQLSFASVMALGLLSRRLAPQPASRGAAREAPIARRMVVWLGRFGAATVAAGAVTAPIVAHHFGEVTPAAPLGNLALVPLIELAILPLALGGALLGIVHPALGWLPLKLAGWGAALALQVADLFRRGAPVVLVPAPNAPETLLLVAAAAALLAALGGVERRRLGWAGAVLLALAGVSLGTRELVRRRSDEVRITFLDVGQGDAAVVEGPRNFVAVIDGGGSYDESFDTGARVVEPFLRARGIGHVDLVVLSHPHPDHLNGLMRVLARFPVGALWTSGDDGHNPRYTALLALARARAVPRPVPHQTKSGGLTLQPLGPWIGDDIGPPPGTSVNDASLVLRLTFGTRAVLFPGDLEGDGEGELVGRAAAGMAIGADVLKVPHHGSRTSSSEELLDSVRPGWAIISLGRHNRFHFPRPEVLARYRERRVRVLRTDEVGAVTVTIDRAGTMVASCARGCPEAELRGVLFTQPRSE